MDKPLSNKKIVIFQPNEPAHSKSARDNINNEKLEQVATQLEQLGASVELKAIHSRYIEFHDKPVDPRNHKKLGDGKVDAALFYNPRNDMEVTPDVMKDIVSRLPADTPVIVNYNHKDTESWATLDKLIPSATIVPADAKPQDVVAAVADKIAQSSAKEVASR